MRMRNKKKKKDGKEIQKHSESQISQRREKVERGVIILRASQYVARVVTQNIFLTREYQPISYTTCEALNRYETELYI